MIKQRPPCESEVGANFTPPRPRGVGGLGGRGGKPAGWGGLALGNRRRGIVGGESSAGNRRRGIGRRASRHSGRAEGEHAQSGCGNVQQPTAKSNNAKRLMAGAGWGIKAPPKCKAVRASQCKGG